MTPERLLRIRALYEAAVDSPAAVRQALLDHECDQELRQEVERLLDAREHLPAWLSGPALGMAHAVEAHSTVTQSALAGHVPCAPGTVLGQRYRIVHLLGRGGMSEVYRADDLLLGQPVALKFLPRGAMASASAFDRFRNEVSTARQVSHPSVCRVYDIGEADGLTYLSMEYVDGEDLASLLRRIGRLPHEKALEIARQLCAGLAAAHDKGVIHRDLKPANIMLDGRGKVRITDFGIAGMAAQIRDVRSGTPAYMSPEQLAGKEVTVRSDIYMLGIVLCELLTGKRPPLETGSTDLDPAVERIIQRCLEPEPQRRPSSVSAVSAALPGGDPLAAALAAGQTPSPDLVASAGPSEGLAVSTASLYFIGLLVGLVMFAVLAPRASMLGRFPAESSEALQRVARDALSTLGIQEPRKHQIGRFAYDLDAVRQQFEARALYFWYRTSPYWMIPSNMQALGSVADPPDDYPGMVTTEWDRRGRLLYLKVVPTSTTAVPVRSEEIWERLFVAAGLPFTRFAAGEPQQTAIPVFDARAAWSGPYPDDRGTPVHVEAAAWRGQPVYFRIEPQTQSSGAPPALVRYQRLLGMQLGIHLFALAVSSVLAWRNLQGRRGDRRGAFRIAAFVFVMLLLSWVFEASHVPDFNEFTYLFLRSMMAVFFGLIFWTFYMALEPFVRRRWPHAIISWSRLLKGELRDPVVGGDLLIGSFFGVTAAVVLAFAALWSHTYSFYLPSTWLLSGGGGPIGYWLDGVSSAVGQGLSLLFFTFLFKVVFRRAWLALLVIIPVAYVFQAATALPPAALLSIVAALAMPLLYLLLRKGLLAAIAAIATFSLLNGLSVTMDSEAPGNTASLLMLATVAGCGWLVLRSTLAGRRLWKMDLP
jgi:serine/threonine-protein kinase